MDQRTLCACLVLLTTLVYTVTCEQLTDSSEESKGEQQLELKKRSALLSPLDTQDRLLYSDTDLLESPSDLQDDVKRSTLFRFGKRGTLLRYGKRQSEEGKRGTLFRFGKRGTLFRFGKRGTLFRFGKRDYGYGEPEYPLEYGLDQDSILPYSNDISKRPFHWGRETDEEK